MIRRHFWEPGCLLIVLAFCTGCGGRKNNSTISTGKETQLAAAVVSKDGGKVTVAKPGDPLDGLMIDIPANSFDNERKYRITSAPIKSHELGPDFNPITPLISISNGGGYSDSIITLTIPVNVPDGQFAMAFLYDAQTGKLEGMPLVVSDQHRVIVATTHFSHSAKLFTPGFAAQADDNSDKNEDQIVVSAVNEAALLGEYDSGFRPGVDDMPCPNNGSFISPLGICSGQSLGALWYYSNKKKKGDAGLYKMLDNDGEDPTPGFWQDDSRAIKFASMLQKDFSLGGLITRFFVSFGDFWGQMLVSDNITKKAFAYGLKLTHEPQFLAINEPYFKSGHALVVYKASGDTLFLADPNFPGVEKQLIYDQSTKKFQPYRSAAKAGDPATDYTHFFYIAKSTMYAWPKAAHHWKNLEADRVGEEKFPEFSIVVLNKDGEFVPLTDGYEVPEDGSMTLNVRSPGFNNRFTVCNDQGKLLLLDSDAPVFIVPSGTQKIGINLLNRGDATWAGFRWVRVKTPKPKEEEKKFGPPDFGDVSIDLKINGSPVTYKTCNFLIENNKLLFRIPLNQEPGMPVQITLEQENWRGLSVYNNLVARIYLINKTGSGYCPVDGANLTVTRWSGGKFSGSFTIDCRCDNQPYKIEGTFNYEDPWLNAK